MSHTPGPWTIFHADEDGGNDILPAMRPGCIAKDIQNDADARLIAAAPQMDRALAIAWQAMAWAINYDSEDKIMARALEHIEAARQSAGTFDYHALRTAIEKTRKQTTA